MLSTKIENTFTIDNQGIKFEISDFKSFLVRNDKCKVTSRMHLGSNIKVPVFYVCGFRDELDHFDFHGNSPYVTIFKTEKEALEFCENKVIASKKFYAESVSTIEKIIENNAAITYSHKKSLYEN